MEGRQSRRIHLAAQKPLYGREVPLQIVSGESNSVRPLEAKCWNYILLLQVEMIEDADWFKILGSGYENWGKLLSTVSFSWLPDENMAIGWRQFSWRKSIHPTAFQFSVQLST